MKFVAALTMSVLVACSSSHPVSQDGGVPDGATDASPDGSTTIDPGLSTITTDRDVVVLGSSPVNVYVTLRDAANDPVVGASVQLVVASGSVTTPAASDAAGQTSAVWTNTVEGTYDVALVVDGATLATHTVQFVPSSTPADMAHSSLVVTPTSLQADGMETSTIAIHVGDASGNPIANANVALSVSGTNNVVTLASSTTDANGNVSATVSSTTAEVKTVTATIDGLTLTGTIHFFGPACTPQLPGGPGVVLDYFGTTLLVDDLDGDGAADAVVVEGHSPVVFRGRGDGTFYPSVTLQAGGVMTVVKAADINGDGHLDLLARVSSSSSVTFYLGLGGGQFAAPTTSGDLGAAVNQFTTGDFNGDGRLDLAVAGGGHTLVIALNQGNGTFAVSQTTIVDMYDLGVADVNLDGKLDLVATSVTGVKSLLGHGDGTFAAPVITAGAGAGRLVIADFNRDGKPDCAVANPGYTLQPFLGTGTATFTRVGSALPTAEYSSSNTTGIAQIAPARDLDGDGNLDLVLGEKRSLTVLRGAGDGTFSLAHVYAVENAAATAGIGLGDADGDGVTDVITMQSWLLSVIHGRPDGSFLAPQTHAEPDVGLLSPTSADFDGDGYRDLLFENGQSIVALLSRPGGTFADAASLAETQTAIALRAADVTGDGLPDVVGIFGASPGVTIRVAGGVGDGTFAPFTTFALPTLNVVGVDFADMDRDGKQDLVLATDYQNGIWLARSNGDGTFAAPQQLSGALFWARTADVNGDGIADVLSSDLSGNTLVYLGDGVGGFGVASTLPGGFLEAVADVTGDGRVDLVMTDGNELSGFEIRVFPGLASGGFGDPLVTWTPEVIDGSMLADVSGDGVLDLIGLSSTTGLSVVQGYGDGYFHTHVIHYPAVVDWGTMVLGDFNRDGMVDIAFDKGLGVGIAFNGGCVP